MAVLSAVLFAVAEPRSAVIPASSLESSAAVATVGVAVAGELIAEPAPKPSLVSRILPVAVLPPGGAAVGGAAPAAAAEVRAAAAGIRIG